jgi:hypothetical protein
MRHADAMGSPLHGDRGRRCGGRMRSGRAASRRVRHGEGDRGDSAVPAAAGAFARADGARLRRRAQPPRRAALLRARRAVHLGLVRDRRPRPRRRIPGAVRLRAARVAADRLRRGLLPAEVPVRVRARASRRFRAERSGARDGAPEDHGRGHVQSRSSRARVARHDLACALRGRLAGREAERGRGRGLADRHRAGPGPARRARRRGGGRGVRPSAEAVSRISARARSLLRRASTSGA